MTNTRIIPTFVVFLEVFALKFCSGATSSNDLMQSSKCFFSGSMVSEYASRTPILLVFSAWIFKGYSLIVCVYNWLVVIMVELQHCGSPKL